MWSLPDIAKLNQDAADQDKKARLVRCAELLVDHCTEKKAQCEHHGEECEGRLTGYLTYDIFSDDPKGVLFLCEHHYGHYGSPDEGYFFCDDCSRIFIENYTWERYDHVEGGEVLCLNCHAKRVIANPKAWIVLTDAAINKIDFERVRRAPHIIAVDGPTHGLIQRGNAEFDSMGGQSIGSGNGVEGLKNALRQAKRKGHKRALLVMDAAYQFAVSIAVYAEPIKKAGRSHKAVARS